MQCVNYCSLLGTAKLGRLVADQASACDEWSATNEGKDYLIEIDGARLLGRKLPITVQEMEALR